MTACRGGKRTSSGTVWQVQFSEKYTHTKKYHFPHSGLSFWFGAYNVAFRPMFMRVWCVISSLQRLFMLVKRIFLV